MKICVIGDGLLINDFQRMEFITYNMPIDEFNIEDMKRYDVIINTYDYTGDSLTEMIKCNVTYPQKWSKYCKDNGIRFVQISTGILYAKHKHDDARTETDEIIANNTYTSTKLLGESVCHKRDIIIRTQNLFNDQCDTDNALYSALINSKPTKNNVSYSWTVDVIRGIVCILKSKKTGIYNITSDGFMSEFDICDTVGIIEMAPHYDNNIIYNVLNCGSLHKYFIPTCTKSAIKKCYRMLEEGLRR